MRHHRAPLASEFHARPKPDVQPLSSHRALSAGFVASCLTCHSAKYLTASHDTDPNAPPPLLRRPPDKQVDRCRRTFFVHPPRQGRSRAAQLGCVGSGALPASQHHRLETHHARPHHTCRARSCERAKAGPSRTALEHCRAGASVARIHGRALRLREG